MPKQIYISAGRNYVILALMEICLFAIRIVIQVLANNVSSDNTGVFDILVSMETKFISFNIIWAFNIIRTLSESPNVLFCFYAHIIGCLF